MIFAPRSTSQRIARASTAGSIVWSAPTTLATSSRAEKAMPAMPWSFPTAAAISPATNVPCPIWSSAEPPTKLRAAAILLASSGWPRSTPVSTIPTRTGGRAGG